MFAKERIPEADFQDSAIESTAHLDMRGYSRFCEKYLAMEYRRIVNLFLDRVVLTPGSRVLEIGPGPAWISILLAEKRPDLEITGLELSADMRRIAEENCRSKGVGNIRFIGGDASQMPFESGSFDGVMSNGSLHHWLNPAAVFDEIARVLKPTGGFAVSDGRRDLGLRASLLFQLFSGVAMLDREVPGRQMRRGWYTSICAGYTKSELTALLAQSSLSPWSLDEKLFDLVVYSTGN